MPHARRSRAATGTRLISRSRRTSRVGRWRELRQFIARTKPELVVVDEAAPKPAETTPADVPFFGRPPDDPGVKPIKAAASGKQGFKLF